MPTKLVAVPRKCTLQVIQFASSDQPRFGRIKNYRGGTSIIPDGFVAESISDGLTWLVMTKVDETGNVLFKCTCKTDETLTSNWVKTMSRAYKLANGNGKKNPNYKKGSNGRIVFGLTYSPAQEEIRRRFGDSIETDFRLHLDPQASRIGHASADTGTALSKKRRDSAGLVSDPPKSYSARRQRRDKAENQPLSDISSPPPPPPPRRRHPLLHVPVSGSSSASLILPSPLQQTETSVEQYSFEYPDLPYGAPLPDWMAKQVGM